MIMGKISTIRYRNYRGEIAIRDVIIIRMWYGSTEYHPDPGWLFDAYDVDKNVERTFAVSGLVDPE